MIARTAVESDAESSIVAAQIGRRPRSPWRVAQRCSHGFPTVIASPSVLEDGERFPTLFWLTCPHLAEAASDAESAGALQEWSGRIEDDPALAAHLIRTDEQLRALRLRESGGEDACGDAGVAGRTATSRSGSAGCVKCLHARVALVLAGVDDPVGAAFLSEVAKECDDVRCAGLTPATHEGSD